MPEKLCVFCKHLEYNDTGSWGDYPDPAKMECMKRHWSGEISYDLSEFRKSILTAETCPDYERPIE